MFMKSIQSEHAPKAIGPYSPAVKLGDFVYLSGQIPVDPASNAVVEGGIVEQTKQVFKNMEAVLAEMGLETRHIVKTTVFLKNMDDFSAMNQVYGSHFNEPYPARSTVEVSRLPKDVLVEIEALVIDTSAYERQMGGGCGDGGCEGGCCGDDEGGCDGCC